MLFIEVIGYYLISSIFVNSFAAITISLIAIIMNKVFLLYKNYILFSKAKQIISLIKSGIYIFLFFAIVNVFYPLNMNGIIESILNIILFSILIRIVFTSIYKRYFIKQNKLLLMCGNAELDTLYESIVINNPEFIVSNILSNKNIIHDFYSVKSKAKYIDFNQVKNIIKTNNIKYIFLGNIFNTKEEISDFIDFAKNENVTILLHSNIYANILTKINSEKVANKKVFIINDDDDSYIKQLIYRLFDIIGSISLIILFLPLFIIIAFLIKKSSPGPIFYTSIRVGKNGKPFRFYKFRSLKIVDEKEEEKRKQKTIRALKNSDKKIEKIVDTSRQTKIGKFIRKTSLDELPQFFNVLKGDMSLVGPRPCLQYEWDTYTSWQKRRLNINPGCTGLWQVVGKGEVSIDEMVALDMYYIEHKTLWLDIEIMLKTLPVMLLGNGDK
jgi:undecaprenyl-phosphate galactose phosphotransferase